MKFLDLKQRLEQFTIFSIKDIQKIDPSFYRSRLNEWQKKGYIQKILRKYYIFTDREVNEGVLFLIANSIYSPSYISLEMALSHYHIIPESVYTITSVSTKKKKTFETHLGTFSYRELKPSLFFGDKLLEFDSQRVRIAEPEKAVLDYLYLNPQLKTSEDFYELRINISQFFEIVDLEKFERYLEAFQNKSLEKRVSRFFSFLRNVES